MWAHMKTKKLTQRESETTSLFTTLPKIWSLLWTLPNAQQFLTLSWRRPISYRKQSSDLRSKSMDWFLYDNGLRHERVNYFRRKAKSKMFDRVLNIHLVVCITNFLIFKLLYYISNFHIFVKTLPGISTAQKWKFSIKDFFSKCD